LALGVERKLLILFGAFEPLRDYRVVPISCERK